MIDSVPVAAHAEAAAICCLIDNPARFTAEAWESQITGEFLHLAHHSALWELITRRFRDGKSVDPVSIREAIKDEKIPHLTVSDLSDVLLTEFDETAWHGYVETLRDRHARRIAIGAGSTVSDQNLNGEDAVAALRDAAERATAALSGISSVMNAKKAVQTFLDKMHEQQANGEIPGSSTGITVLDQLTGGLRKGELWVIGGKTSMGKSALMLQIAESVIDDGKRVAIFSMEMEADEIVGRLISCSQKIDFGEIRNPRTITACALPKIKTAAQALATSGLMICDAADQTIETISGNSQRLADSNGIDLVVIDYLQLITARRIKGQNREQEVAAMSRGCKQLAKRLKCPVITATQLNEMGQTRESRAIENDADAVFLIHPKNDGMMSLQVWKCRNAKRGDTFEMKFHGHHQQFIFL